MRSYGNDTSIGDQDIRFQNATLGIMRQHHAAVDEEVALGARRPHAFWKISSLRTPM